MLSKYSKVLSTWTTVTLAFKLTNAKRANVFRTFSEHFKRNSNVLSTRTEHFANTFRTLYERFPKRFRTLCRTRLDAKRFGTLCRTRLEAKRFRTLCRTRLVKVKRFQTLSKYVANALHFGPNACDTLAKLIPVKRYFFNKCSKNSSVNKNPNNMCMPLSMDKPKIPRRYISQ